MSELNTDIAFLRKHNIFMFRTLDLILKLIEDTFELFEISSSKVLSNSLVNNENFMRLIKVNENICYSYRDYLQKIALVNSKVIEIKEYNISKGIDTFEKSKEEVNRIYNTFTNVDIKSNRYEVIESEESLLKLLKLQHALRNCLKACNNDMYLCSKMSALAEVFSDKVFRLVDSYTVLLLDEEVIEYLTKLGVLGKINFKITEILRIALKSIIEPSSTEEVTRVYNQVTELISKMYTEIDNMVLDYESKYSVENKSS